jgi:hypothetical protein
MQVDLLQLTVVQEAAESSNHPTVKVTSQLIEPVFSFLESGIVF